MSRVGMNIRVAAFAVGALALASGAQAGDTKNGAQVFHQCQTCHTADKGAANGLGPNLFGIVGRKAGTVAGFSYSAALKSSGIVWTNDKLKAWVAGPSKLVPGTRMFFPGITDPKKADDLAAYLATLK